MDIRYVAIINDKNDAPIMIKDWALCMFIKLSRSILWPGRRRRANIADSSVDMLISTPMVVSVDAVSGKNKPAIIVTSTISINDVMVKNIGVPSNHERNVIENPPCVGLYQDYFITILPDDKVVMWVR